MRPLALLALAALAPAFAQVPGAPDTRFDSTTCHTWEGGLGAQGSFTKCTPQVVVIQTPPRVDTRVETRVETRTEQVLVERPCPVAAPAPVVRAPAKRAKPVQRCERWVPVN